MTTSSSEQNGNFRGGAYSIHKREGNSYRAMKNRCRTKSYRCYSRYGGRGIKICDRWLGKDGFANFYADMGDRPDNCTLDRIDNDGDYCPENCRWANQKEQISNSSLVINAKITSKDMLSSVVSVSQVYKRLRNGWSKEDALSIPAVPPGEQCKARNLAIKMKRPRCANCGKLVNLSKSKYCSRDCYIHYRYYREEVIDNEKAKLKEEA